MKNAEQFLYDLLDCIEKVHHIAVYRRLNGYGTIDSRLYAQIDQAIEHCIYETTNYHYWPTYEELLSLLDSSIGWYVAAVIHICYGYQLDFEKHVTMLRAGNKGVEDYILYYYLKKDHDLEKLLAINNSWERFLANTPSPYGPANQLVFSIKQVLEHKATRVA